MNNANDMTEAAAALGLESLTSRDEIGRYLLSFCELHRRAMTPAILNLFCEALADLTPRELRLGFQEVARRTRFFPTPADVRDAMEAALERMPRQRRQLAAEDCPKCSGCGWRTVEKDGRRMAILCSCTKRSAA